MRKVTLALLAVAVVLVGTATLALAGGGSAKGVDVCWTNLSGTESRAVFLVTGSGIVQEWRYQPQDVHVVFKPADRFPVQEDDWTYWNAVNYADCSPATATADKVGDFLPPGTHWWYRQNSQP